ncbi:helix-turn-helix domain-containing protein [Parvibaculum sp.]|uniref:helix-turn-helix domain-containing protein n=1 Tax=Parvibaculum sp. TaxID=2024848 RepID=UPI00344CD062
MRRLARRREIEHFAIGGELRFTREQVHAFLETQRKPITCPATENPPANSGSQSAPIALSGMSPPTTQSNARQYCARPKRPKKLRLRKCSPDSSSDASTYSRPIRRRQQAQ